MERRAREERFELLLGQHHVFEAAEVEPDAVGLADAPTRELGQVSPRVDRIDVQAAGNQLLRQLSRPGSDLDDAGALPRPASSAAAATISLG